MRVKAEIEIDITPETVEHCQVVLDNDTKYRSYNIYVKEIIE